MWRLALGAVLVMTAGCAGRPFTHLEYSYRISDNPAAGSITVAPSLGDYIGGTPSRERMRDVYRTAARRFLAESGRQCSITDAKPTGLTGWEFHYEC